MKRVETFVFVGLRIINKPILWAWCFTRLRRETQQLHLWLKMMQEGFTFCAELRCFNYMLDRGRNMA